MEHLTDDLSIARPEIRKGVPGKEHGTRGEAELPKTDLNILRHGEVVDSLAWETSYLDRQSKKK